MRARTPDYCGCCGRVGAVDALWCRDCQAHVLRSGPLEQRTIYGQHDGKYDCPFSVRPFAPRLGEDAPHA